MSDSWNHAAEMLSSYGLVVTMGLSRIPNAEETVELSRVVNVKTPIRTSRHHH
jgi:hypothetical protein